MYNFRLKFLLLFLLTMLSYNTSAKEVAAVVTKLKGNVTKLLPGAINAINVKEGDKLYVDTSIVTRNRSFVRLTFEDGTRVSVGSNSKFVISEVHKKEGSVLSLLKGRMRAKVEPNEDGNDKNKLYIATRTAALGVRGTDFQVIYNPDNQITNLLTFKGEVAMAKVSEEHGENYIKKGEQLNISRNKNNTIEFVAEDVDLPVTSSQGLGSILKESKNTVSVKAGQYSGVADTVSRPSKPVLINHTQLGVLFQNEDLITEASPDSAVDVSKVDRYVRLDTVPTKVAPEGFYNTETGEFAPKSGGLIDINSGLYISPEKDAVFNEARKVFIPKKIGRIDALTGQYFPPIGLRLDPGKGFVALKLKSGVNKDLSNLLAKRDDLNESISKDMYLKREEQEVDLRKWAPYSHRELLTKYSLDISVSSFEKEIEVTESESLSNEVLKLSGGTKLDILWTLIGNGSLQPFINFSYKTYTENNTRYKYDNNSLFKIGAGLNKYLSRRWIGSIGFNIDQEFIPAIVEVDSTQQNKFEKVAFNKLYIRALGNIIKIKKASIGVDAKLYTNLYKSSTNVSVKNGFGSYVEGFVDYWFKKDHQIKFSVWNEFASHEIRSSFFNAKLEKTTSGTGVKYLVAF